MPYVTLDQREYLVQGNPSRDAGELNFVITQQLLFYWRHPSYDFATRREWFYVLMRDYWKDHDRRYQTANDIAGAMTCAIAEFKRRREPVAPSFFEPLRTAHYAFYQKIVAPYEDEKIAQNGDVY